MKIFNENNTYWDWDDDDEGHRRQELFYDGDIEELSKETGLSEDKLIDMLDEYRYECRDAIETLEQIAHDYQSSQIGRFYENN